MSVGKGRVQFLEPGDVGWMIFFPTSLKHWQIRAAKLETIALNSQEVLKTHSGKTAHKESHWVHLTKADPFFSRRKLEALECLDLKQLRGHIACSDPCVGEPNCGKVNGKDGGL